MFDLPPDLHLAVVLQNTAGRRFRLAEHPGMTPSEVLAASTPTPWGPGLNELIRPPTYPRITSAVPDGIMISNAGRRVWELNNAISAFQNTLRPPTPPVDVDAQTAAAGRKVFERAGCSACHGGPRLTNNRIIPLAQIRTEPSRARALAKAEPVYDPNPKLHAFDTPVPVPEDARAVDVPQNLPPDQLALSMAFDNPGGYKVKGLIGLYYTPPYLHDGGAALGPNLDTDIGVAGTLLKGIRPDPEHSLQALVDRRVRSRVIAANKASERPAQSAGRGRRPRILGGYRGRLCAGRAGAVAALVYCGPISSKSPNSRRGARLLRSRSSRLSGGSREGTPVLLLHFLRLVFLVHPHFFAVLPLFLRHSARILPLGLRRQLVFAVLLYLLAFVFVVVLRAAQGVFLVRLIRHDRLQRCVSTV